MTFKEYQIEASKTEQKYVAQKELNDIVPFLGIIGEAGSVLTELKKRIMDGDGYSNFKNQLKEELGDVLWYISDIASKNNIDLEEIALSNITKTKDRFSSEDDPLYKPFDENFPSNEKFPREFEVRFTPNEENGRKQMKIEIYGEAIGNPLTDNSYEEDGYRFHDIFHFGYVAYIGWSPVIRKLMKIKRKSDGTVDEVEDGARAGIIEELITLYVFSYAQNHRLFKYTDRVDSEILNAVKKLVSSIEVKNVSSKQWELAIIQSYKVYDELKENNGGRVMVSVKNRKLIYLGKN
jgi:NTP pyrophosphatase (non-canonical NTP hydrolase)